MSARYAQQLVLTKELLKLCIEQIPELSDQIDLELIKSTSEEPFSIAVIGAMKSGKSTFINALLGKDLMPNENEACTLTTTDVIHAPHDGKIEKLFFNNKIVSITGNPLAQFFHEDVRESRKNPSKSQFAYRVYHELEALKDRVQQARPFLLIDTPGINEMENGGLTKSHFDSVFENTLKRAKAILYIIDVQYYKAEENKEILQTLKNLRPDLVKNVVFVLNKVDKIVYSKDGSLESVINNVSYALSEWGYVGNTIFPVSARKALLARLTCNNELPDVLRQLMLSYIPEREIIVDDEVITIKDSPKKAHMGVLETSGFLEFEERFLTKIYDQVDNEAEKEGANRLSSLLNQYIGILNKKLRMILNSQASAKEQLKVIRRKIISLNKIEKVCNTAKENFENTAKEFESQQKIFKNKDFQIPSIPSPGQLNSRNIYGSSFSAHQAGKEAFGIWFQDAVSKLSLQVYTSYKDELVAGKRNFYKETANLFVKQNKHYYEKMKKLKESLKEELVQVPPLVLHNMLPEEFSDYQPNALGLDVRKFENLIQVDSSTKSFLLFFKDTNYNFSIERSIEKSKKEIQQALNDYDQKLRFEVMKKKYVNFPNKIKKKLLENVEIELNQIVNLSKKMEQLQNKKNDELKSKRDLVDILQKTIAFSRHTSKLLIPIVSTLPLDTQLDKLISASSPDTLINLPPGDFVIEANHEFQHGLIIRGSGRATTIRFRLDGCIKIHGDYSLLTLEQLQIKYESSNTAVRFNGLYTNIEECSFEGNLNQDGIWLEGMTEADLKGCTFDRLDNGILIVTDNTVRITNGIIRNCQQSGIVSKSRSRTVIHDVAFYANKTGMQFKEQAKGIVSNAVFYGHLKTGIDIRDCSFPVIQDSDFFENCKAVEISGSSIPVISRNIFISQKQAGIVVRESSKVEIKSNTFESNPIGILLNDESNSLVNHNILQYNIKGIEAKGKTRGKIRNNRFLKQKLSGVHITETSILDVSENDCTENEIGILISGNSAPNINLNYLTAQNKSAITIGGLAKPTLYKNNCDNNLIGILIENEAEPILNENEITNNYESGIISIDNTRGIYENNKIKGNLIGISISGTSHPELLMNVCELNNTAIRLADTSQPLLTGNIISTAKIGIHVMDKVIAHIDENEVKDCGTGIFGTNQAEIILLNSQLLNHQFVGMQIKEDCQSLMDGNRFESCVNGVLVDGNVNFKMKNNIVLRCSNGILARSHASGLITDNDIKENTVNGVLLQDEIEINVSSNICIENNRGITVLGNALPHISGNWIARNRRSGIHFGMKAGGIVNSNQISQNDAGITCAEHSNPTFFENEIYQNINGCVIDQKATALFSSNRFESNLEKGIQILDSGDKVFVTKNTFTANHLVSIHISGTAQSIISENVVSKSQVGIHCDGNSSTKLTKNIVQENTAFGFCIESEARSEILENQLSKNGQGLNFNGSAKVNVENNITFENLECGIRIEGLADAKLIRNKISKNGKDGIQAKGDSHFVIHNNETLGNEGSGISVEERAFGELRNNQSNLNTQFGVRIEPRTAVIIAKTKKEKNGFDSFSKGSWKNQLNIIKSRRNAKRLEKQRREG